MTFRERVCFAGLASNAGNVVHLLESLSCEESSRSPSRLDSLDLAA